jgi:hypothetical protein
MARENLILSVRDNKGGRETPRTDLKLQNKRQPGKIFESLAQINFDEWFLTKKIKRVCLVIFLILYLDDQLSAVDGIENTLLFFCLEMRLFI